MLEAARQSFEGVLGVIAGDLAAVRTGRARR